MKAKSNELTVHGGCIHGSPSICMGSSRDVLWTERQEQRMKDRAVTGQVNDQADRGHEAPIQDFSWTALNTVLFVPTAPFPARPLTL